MDRMEDTGKRENVSNETVNLENAGMETAGMEYAGRRKQSRRTGNCKSSAGHSVNCSAGSAASSSAAYGGSCGADYAAWIAEIAGNAGIMQVKSAYSVNREMLMMYWSLGEELAKADTMDLGSGYMEEASRDLKALLPSQRCLSPTNLGYMRRFYLLYRSLSPIEREELFCVPWGHHRVIMDKCGGDVQRAMFCVRETLAHGWTRAYLTEWIDTGGSGTEIRADA